MDHEALVWFFGMLYGRIIGCKDDDIVLLVSEVNM